VSSSNRPAHRAHRRLGVAIFSQLTGVNTVVYYAPTILEKAASRSAAPSNIRSPLGSST